MRAAREDYDLDDESEFESILGHPNENLQKRKALSNAVDSAHGRARAQRGVVFLVFFGFVAFFIAIKSGIVHLEMNVKVGNVQDKGKQSSSSSNADNVVAVSTAAPVIAKVAQATPSPTQAKITPSPVKVVTTSAPVVAATSDAKEASPSPAADAAKVQVTTEAPVQAVVVPENPVQAVVADEFNKYNDFKGNPNTAKTAVNDASYWGQWELNEHASLKSLKREDYCKNTPHCDIPNTQFPPNSWQRDPQYVKQLVREGLKLVNRTKESIYAEYGAGYPLTDEITKRRDQMFTTRFANCTAETRAKVIGGHGGWMCQESLEGLTRRMLHAIITQDEFSISLGGHSVAAGHDNHFAQSYIHQVHHVMEPVLARLGVSLYTRNLAHGGLGTLESSLGSGDIFGRENDVLMWDSGMTEHNKDYIELFYRQAALSGNKIPFYIGTVYADHAGYQRRYGADVASFANDNDAGFLVTTSDAQAKTLPWASQYHVCEKGFGGCGVWENMYHITCWVDREDVTPPVKQLDRIRTSRHPTHTQYQVKGRGIAMLLLTGLEHALLEWRDFLQEDDSTTLFSEDRWHVSDYYTQLKEKVKNDGGVCEEILKESKMFPARVCTTAMKGRTQFTPRANPDETSLTSIMKDYKLPNETFYKTGMLYEGPDVPNPSLAIPEGHIDVRLIASAGLSDLNVRKNKVKRDLAVMSSKNQSQNNDNDKETTMESTTTDKNTRSMVNGVEQSQLWFPTDGDMVGFCDGSPNSYNCRRNDHNNCLLLGHNDDRQGILGDGHSGWIVFNLNDYKEGLIIVKVHAWYHKLIVGKLNPLTVGMDTPQARLLRGSTSTMYDEGWSNITNMSWEMGEDYAANQDEGRYLKADPVMIMPETFKFDFAINGKVTTYDKKTFWDTLTNPERVVQLFTFQDIASNAVQKNFPDGNVEVAIRLRDCGRDQMMHITHIYWA